ncbi:MAG: polyprenyl synthetase family protein [Syntrophorhabdaceae bacterium]|nr:polyprenyl synthetase family protein [Syntrophorhabdaceae bacterium]
MEKVLKFVEEDLKRLEESIEKLVTTRVGFIKEIVNYIIKAGGKRIRPILVILCSKMCGYKGEKYITYAAIVEFIHTATLLHDDVVDNAKTRRGTSTANTIWGNEASVLVGDFLYAKSFELMGEEDNLEIVKVMARTTKLLSEGEILELVKTSDITTKEEEYFEIIGNKTAILFSAACEIGSILGKADPDTRGFLKDFGYNLGMAFQLTDDILDYTSYDEVFGKKIGTDLKEGKVTLPLIHAIGQATEKEKKLIERLLNKGNITAKEFSKAFDLISKYGGIEYTSEKARIFTEKAKTSIMQFPPSPYREALLSIPEHILSRRA